jgi:hypothetical protein
VRKLLSLRATGSLALLVATFVLSASASSARPAAGGSSCTGGASSIGPVYVRGGKVVGGDTTPHTERCLP